jgi:tRNA nucleotidyltransferase/poly(A) polymerase
VKLSFERIGVELDKMCGGNNPHLAMQHLYEINIMPLLYKFPPEAQELQQQNVVDELLQRSVGLCDILGQEFMKEKENAGHLKDLLGIDLTKTNLSLSDF